MILVDVHCHLDCIDDSDSAVARAKEAGVKKIVAAGIDVASNRKVLELAAKHDIVEAMIGIYPPDAHDVQYNVEAELKWMRKQKGKIIGIGEIGMDFHTGKDAVMQEQVFRSCLSLAEELKLPVVVHSRKAEEKVLEILKDYKIIVVLHCFSGKKNLVKEGAKRGYYFSVPTNIVRAQNFQDLVKEVNLSQLLTETDAPWLSPFKEKKNEPAFVIESVKKIAAIKGMTDEDTAKNIFMNYQRVFG